MKKILITAFFILTTAAIVLMIYNHGITNNLDLFALSHSPISIQEEDKLLFWEKGFAIVNDHTTFFDNNGQQTTFPFDIDNDIDQDFAITAITRNYLLTNGNTIYRIEGSTLKKIYSLESNAVGLKEYGRYLLVITDNPENNIKLEFLDPENGHFSDLGFDDNLYYLDMDYDTSTSNLSVLTLDIDGVYPSSKILHYDKDLSLYGFTSSVDHVFYRVFKFPSITILIGNRELMCYNIGGDLEWKIENNRLNGFQALRNDLGLLVYFDKKIQEEDGKENFNAIFFNNNGDKQDINLPPQLTHIAPFKNNFIALQYGRNIITINKDGKVESEFFLDEDIKNIIINPYQSNNIYILNANDILQVYSTTGEDY